MAGDESVVEVREVRLRRLGIRSWRRGTKEMDLVLGGYADACLAGLDGAALDAYEALIAEGDQDLFGWICAGLDCPLRHAAAVARIRAFHGLG